MEKNGAKIRVNNVKEKPKLQLENFPTRYIIGACCFLSVQPLNIVSGRLK